MYLAEVVTEPMLTDFKRFTDSEACVVLEGNEGVVTELSAQYFVLLVRGVSKLFDLLFSEVLLFGHMSYI